MLGDPWPQKAGTMCPTSLEVSIIFVLPFFGFGLLLPGQFPKGCLPADFGQLGAPAQKARSFTYECRNLFKKPLVVYRVLNKDSIALGIQNQGFLNQVPSSLGSSCIRFAGDFLPQPAAPTTERERANGPPKAFKWSPNGVLGTAKFYCLGIARPENEDSTLNSPSSPKRQEEGLLKLQRQFCPCHACRPSCPSWTSAGNPDDAAELCS